MITEMMINKIKTKVQACLLHTNKPNKQTNNHYGSAFLKHNLLINKSIYIDIYIYYKMKINIYIIYVHV